MTTFSPTDVSPRNLADLAGEIANTISGNARRMFGHEFIISVPDVITDPHQQIALPANIKSYVIPLSWQQEEAALVVSVV